MASLDSKSGLRSRADLANIEGVAMVKHLEKNTIIISSCTTCIQNCRSCALGVIQSDDPFAKVKGLITDILSKLHDKADAGIKSILREASTNPRRDYSMLRRLLDDSIAADTKDLGE